MLWHCWLGDRKDIRPAACKKLDVGLLVVMIWLELCTTYSSSCHHRFHHLLLQQTPANPGSPGKWPLKRREKQIHSAILLSKWFEMLAINLKFTATFTESHHTASSYSVCPSVCMSVIDKLGFLMVYPCVLWYILIHINCMLKSSSLTQVMKRNHLQMEVS